MLSHLQYMCPITPSSPSYHFLLLLTQFYWFIFEWQEMLSLCSDSAFDEPLCASNCNSLNNQQMLKSCTESSKSRDESLPSAFKSIWLQIGIWCCLLHYFLFLPHQLLGGPKVAALLACSQVFWFFFFFWWELCIIFTAISWLPVQCIQCIKKDSGAYHP